MSALKSQRRCGRCAEARRHHGFTLVELALVLLILALLASSLLMPASRQIEAKQRRQALAQLQDIELALTGFAIIHGRLPCPSMETDPGAVGYGIEAAPPCNFSHAGLLPWRSLGVAADDPWGQPWHYRPDAGFVTSPITAASLPQTRLQIFTHDNRLLSIQDSQAVAVFFSPGANRHADGHNAHYSSTQPKYQAGEASADFDDLLRWLGRPLLLARLAQAGRL